MAKSRDPVDQIEFMRNLLAFLLVGAFISVFPVLTFFIIPDVNKDIVTYMVGQLSGMATTVIAFYLGKNVGSDALDAKKSENTGKAFDAVASALKGTGNGAVEEAADATAEAAVDKAAEIKGEKK